MDETDIITSGHDERRRVRPLAVTGVALLALGAGSGIGFAATHGSAPASASALAASSSQSPSPSPSPSAAPDGPGKHFRGFGPGMGFAIGIDGGAGGVVHGQVTVPKSGGGYQTLDIQRGTVTAVSSSSITVKSSDGYTATYAVTSNTLVNAKSAGIGSVRSGDSVFVTATVSGSTATAASVTDTSAIKDGRASFGFPTAPPMSGSQGPWNSDS